MKMIVNVANQHSTVTVLLEYVDFTSYNIMNTMLGLLIIRLMLCQVQNNDNYCSFVKTNAC